MYGLSRATARLCASPSASCKVVVSLSIRMAGFLRITPRLGASAGFQGGGLPALDSAQEDGLGQAKAQRRAGERTDHVGQRMAEREDELTALQQDQRLGGERRERREAAEKAGDEEQSQQLVRRSLEPEQ